MCFQIEHFCNFSPNTWFFVALNAKEKYCLLQVQITKLVAWEGQRIYIFFSLNLCLLSYLAHWQEDKIKVIKKKCLYLQRFTFIFYIIWQHFLMLERIFAMQYIKKKLNSRYILFYANLYCYLLQYNFFLFLIFNCFFWMSIRYILIIFSFYQFCGHNI